MSIGREDLHRLIEEIPDGELQGVQRYLEYVRDIASDPVRRSIETAPLDDEPESEEERQGVEEAMADIRAGRTMSTEELKRELGL